MIHRYHVGDARMAQTLAATYQQASALAIKRRRMTVILIGLVIERADVKETKP